jgi:hypothetical protein
MGLLKKENLLTKEDLERVKVDLGNDEFVYVRQMTAHERDLFERSLLIEVKNMQGTVTGHKQNLEDFRAKFAVATMCDEEGNSLLEQKDAAALSKSISAAKIIKIVDAAQKLNKMSEDEKEDLIKNSDVVLADNSSSDSVES